MPRRLRTAAETFDRRRLMQQASAAAALAACGSWAGAAGEVRAAETSAAPGRIKQSVCYWCFHDAGDRWETDQLCTIAKELGCGSVELIGPEHWKTLERHGLICALAGNGMPGAPFMRGFNNPRYREELVVRTKEAVDACAAAGFPAVIAFTGYKWRDADDPASGEISREEGADNCVAGLKEVMSHAERAGVNICLEHLNTRDDSHPMKGHPGYQGDDLDYVADILRRVGSPRLKLLFDIYHVQVMHGDVIRRLEQNKDLVGHVHTAGNPGRGELDADQEINFPAIMRKLLEMDYRGYVGQEFIPTRDALAGLRQAVELCNV